MGLAHRGQYRLRIIDGRPNGVSFHLGTSCRCGLRVRRSRSFTFALSKGKGLKMPPNPRSAVDAGFALCLRFGRHWYGATDSGRSESARHTAI